MEQKLTLADLASGLSRRASVPLRYSEDFVRSFFNVIEDGLMHDNIVKVKGFGTFKLVGVDARESINVNTGERIEIAGHTKVSFIPDPAIRDTVNKPFLEFETVILNEGTDTAIMEAMDVESEIAEVTDLTDVPVAQPMETPEEETVDEDTSVEEKEQVKKQEETIEIVKEEVPTEVVNEPMEQVEKKPIEKEMKSQSAEAEITQPAVCKKCTCCHCWSHFFLFLLTAAVFTVIGYILAEYWHPVTLPKLCSENTEEKASVATKTLTDNIPAKVVTPADSVTAVSSGKEKHVKQPSETLAYPQVEDGEYWIVGIEGTEIMKPGCTLLNFSIKYYKSKDFVNYICTMNDIKNPDIVSLNKELRIPKLKKK